MRNIYTMMFCGKKKPTFQNELHGLPRSWMGAWSVPVMESHQPQGLMAAWADQARRRDDPGRRKAAQPITGPGGRAVDFVLAQLHGRHFVSSRRRAGNAGGIHLHALGADKVRVSCLAPCFA